MTSHPLRVVCVGDSITQGQVSVDYVGLLRKRLPSESYVLVNRGVGGDFAYNILQRLDQVVADEPDHVMVLAGTNDANASLSAGSRRLMTWIKRLPTMPTPQWFRDNLSEIVRRLRQRTDARIALLSLPVIGEDLDSVPMRRAAEYSAIVREIAATHDVTYLPLHERQVDYLRSRGHQPRTQYSSGVRAVTAALQHFVLRRSLDDIAERRGLLLTVDTVHQSSRGATIIADLIEQHLATTVQA
jgi:lysophospholipase L1-like esterase